MLLFILVTCRSQFDLYCLRFSSTDCTEISSRISSFFIDQKECTKLFVWKISSRLISIVLSFFSKGLNFAPMIKELGQPVHYTVLFFKISGPHPHLPVVQLALTSLWGRSHSDITVPFINRGTAAEQDCPEAIRWHTQVWATSSKPVNLLWD